MPGYQEGEPYVDALAACDAGLFLVPGTDVSCRALREWMAMGRPVIATRRPPLPELIDDGVDGWLVDENAAALADAVTACAAPSRLEQAGAHAAEKAATRFDPERVAEQSRLLLRMATLAVPGVIAHVRTPVAATMATTATTETTRTTTSPTTAIVAAVRPGRLDAVTDWARREGTPIDSIVAFHPGRSRDAVIDLITLVRAKRPRLVLLEPHAEWDASVAEELRRAAPETIVLLERGARNDSIGALANRFPQFER